MLYLDSLLKLADPQEPPVVSIFIPVQNVLHMQKHLKTALKKLESTLGEQLSKSKIAHFLAPISDLLTTPNTWKECKSGLAIFRGAEFFMVLPAPHKVALQTLVNGHFHLLPLILYFEQSQLFHILDLNTASLALYEANAFFFRPLALCLENTHWKQDLLALLHKTRTPLVLAGTSTEQKTFLADTTYPFCTQFALSPPTGTLFRPKALHKAFLANIERLLEESRHRAWEELQTLQNTDSTLSNIREVANAAYNSRIESLFIHTQVTSTPITQADTLNESQDLLNTAIRHTLLNGGRIYPLASQQAGPVAAILRY